MRPATGFSDPWRDVLDLGKPVLLKSVAVVYTYYEQTSTLGSRGGDGELMPRTRDLGSRIVEGRTQFTLISMLFQDLCSQMRSNSRLFIACYML